MTEVIGSTESLHNWLQYNRDVSSNTLAVHLCAVTVGGCNAAKIAGTRAMLHTDSWRQRALGDISEGWISGRMGEDTLRALQEQAGAVAGVEKAEPAPAKAAKISKIPAPPTAKAKRAGSVGAAGQSKAAAASQGSEAVAQHTNAVCLA